MLGSLSSLSKRNLAESGVSFVKSFLDFSRSPFASFSLDRVNLVPRCCRCKRVLSTYVWPYSKSPSENQVLFEAMLRSNVPNSTSIGDGVSSVLITGGSVNGPDKLENIEQVYQRITFYLENNQTDCLKNISRLLRSNGHLLSSMRAPFDSHFASIKKIDQLLLDYCQRLRKDVWTRSKFIDEVLTLSLDLYQFSPPTTMFYCNHLVNQILGKTNLTREQFLRLMFCCIINRRSMRPFQIDWSENFISQNLDCFNLDQLAVILVAFHKTKSRLSDAHLYEKIISKITSEADSSGGSIIRSSLIKGLNYSLVLPNTKTAENLIDSVLRLNDLSIYNFIHLGEFSVSRKIYSPKLIDRSLNILVNAIDHLRIKDIERILKCSTAFDHLKPPIPKQIEHFIHQLDDNFREAEDSELDKTVPSLLRSIFLLEIYPPKMINYILSKEWIKQIRLNSFDIHLHYWLLMTIRDCLMIEKHNEYAGKLSNLDTVFTMGRKRSEFRFSIETITAKETRKSLNNRNLNDLYQATMDAFPGWKTALGYILSTSQSPDLILTPSMKHVNQLDRETVRSANCFDKAFAIVYLGKQVYIDSKYCQISGHYRLRERLLRNLGFKVINVPFYEIYHKVDEFGNQDLVNYIKKRVMES